MLACSRQLILLAPGGQHREVPCPPAHLHVPHPLQHPLPACWRWPLRLGAAGRAAERCVLGGGSCAPDSCRESIGSSTFPQKIHLSHAPQELHQVVGPFVTTGAENNIIQVSFPNLCGSVE